MKRSAIAIACVMILGCYVAPKQYVAIDKDITFDVSYDKAWAAVVDYASTTGIAISALEKESGLLSMGPATALPGDCDCGSGMGVMITQRAVRASFVVHSVDSMKTKITVNCSFSGWNNSGLGGKRWIQCVSTGETEARIFSRLGERLF